MQNLYQLFRFSRKNSYTRVNFFFANGATTYHKHARPKVIQSNFIFIVNFLHVCGTWIRFIETNGETVKISMSVLFYSKSEALGELLSDSLGLMFHSHRRKLITAEWITFSRPVQLAAFKYWWGIGGTFNFIDWRMELTLDEV